jgi:hypothetical protein
MKPPQRPWFMPARDKRIARILLGAIVIAAAVAFYLGSTFR